jgi:uncharacterized protein
MPVNFTGSYTQNFDSLATTGTGATANTWTNDTTIAGWSLFNKDGAAIGTYNADTGGSNTGSFNSYGTTGSTDRALGGAASNGAYFGTPASGSVAGYFAFAASNGTGATVNTLNLKFNGEQWRNGGNASAQSMVLEYGFGATFAAVTSWTKPGGSFDWNSPVISATAAAVDGNVAGKVADLGGTLNNLNWSTSDTLWLRWIENNDSGNDHGLAIDDFALSATTGGGGGLPLVSIASTANAAEAGLSKGNFRISRTGPTTSSVDVPFSFTGSAIVNTDYSSSPVPGLVTIPIGAAFIDITITPVDDTSVEGNEDVIATLSTPAGYALGTATAKVTIADNDLPPSSGITKIHDIQGSGSTFNSLYAGARTIEGIVTRAFGKLSGFYVQEEDADADTDAATSEAIFVYDPTGLFKGNVGDKVNISGTAKEFTTPTSTSSLTQFDTLTNVTVVSSGNALPTVTKIQLPVASESVLERYEGMLVNLSAATGDLTVTENYQLGRYGQVVLAATGPGNQTGTDARLEQYTQFNAPSVAGYAAYLTQLDNRKIYLDDANSAQNPDPEIFARGGNPLSATNTLRSGDTVASVTGILDERFEGYRIQTTAPVNFVASNPRPATPPAVGGTLKVASFNVLNYFNDLDTGASIPIGGKDFQPRGANNAAEFTRQRNKTIQAIVGTGADVLGLMELENNGFGSSSAIADLVSGLNAVAGAGTYSYIAPKTAISTDAITVGMIYKSAKVTPVGDAATLPVGKVNTPDGTYTYSGAFDTVGRRPLAQTFKEIATGESFTLVANHFKSKGSSSGTAGDADILDGQGFSNGIRTREAQDLAKWLATNPTGTTDTDYLVLGDLNAYAKEDPLTTLAAAGYANLLPTSTYSYVFNGQVGSLDHALGTSSLAKQVSGVDEWHINADEPLVLDYNTEFKLAGQVTSFYSADQYRSSDHDPILVGLNLKSGTTVPTPATRNDFNGDKKADILWRSDVGGVAVWQMDGATVSSGSLTSTPNLDTTWKAAGTGDFNGDGKSDILWRNSTTGNVAVWTMNGNAITSSVLTSTPTLASSWKTVGVADFSGDGKSDILWRNDDDRVVLWTMDGSTITSSSLTSTPTLAASWKAVGTGDFNGDSKADVLWRNDDGSIALWQMNGTAITSTATSTSSLSSSWKAAGTGDFNGDGKTDVLWRNTTTNAAVVWQMDGATVTSSTATSTAGLDSTWQVADIADFNGDGKADILWSKNTGATTANATQVWTMNGSSVLSATPTSVQPLVGWQVAAPIV